MTWLITVSTLTLSYKGRGLLPQGRHEPQKNWRLHRLYVLTILGPGDIGSGQLRVVGFVGLPKRLVSPVRVVCTNSSYSRKQRQRTWNHWTLSRVYLEVLIKSGKIKFLILLTCWEPDKTIGIECGWKTGHWLRTFMHKKRKSGSCFDGGRGCHHKKFTNQYWLIS